LYGDRHPTPQDIFWIVEVAKTSLTKDLDLKATIYASAGVQEYWVLDLSARRIIVFRHPQDGTYTEENTFVEGTIAPLAFPEVAVSVGRLLS
jgi:Uma2 family endonuclease